MPTGSVEWFDIRTPDPETAKAFYAELFAWTFQPFAPLGEVIGATIWHDGKEIGMITQADGAVVGTASTVLFVYSEDLRGTVEQAVKLGGTVRSEPSMMDAESGAFAELADPTGVPIGVWSMTL
ncbi:VOC family protein [Polymorphospora rubra]|uniref:VOC family protein n=1 Tax=Polymorphospora rubra TaxID=338584 RepID=UPI0033D96787